MFILKGLKVDVENYEYFVFKGASKLLIKNKPIIYCELWDNEMKTRCFNFLKNLDYKIKVVQNKDLVDYDPVNHQTQNFIFIP